MSFLVASNKEPHHKCTSLACACRERSSRNADRVQSMLFEMLLVFTEERCTTDTHAIISLHKHTLSKSRSTEDCCLKQNNKIKTNKNTTLFFYQQHRLFLSSEPLFLTRCIQLVCDTACVSASFCC